MSRYTEEHIFNYLDQAMSPEAAAAFEQEMSKDPELKAAVDNLRNAHDYLQANQLEPAPAQLPDRVMAEVRKVSSEPYYRPSGLFSNTSFLLVSGILTALVAFLSIMQSGDLSLQTVAPNLNEISYFQNISFDGIISKKAITNSFMVICGVLGLALLDRFLLNPYFRKKPRQLGLN